MEIQTLKNNILKAYSAENLNKISVVLLSLYKNEQFGTLQKIADMISDFVLVEIDENGKGFSKLMMLYHPDRGNFHRVEIERLASENNFDKVLSYSHILKLERLEEISALLESYEDIDYSPVYVWDFDTEGFSVNSDIADNLKTEQKFRVKNKYISFYEAIKIRQYGHTKISFPAYYLEDIDEIELSDSGIRDLDGLQFCIHAINIDLSDNHINDLRPIENLGLLETLNLSNNSLEIIDSLEYLIKLRELDISHNRIRDIEPLFALERLEFVDLRGNPVHKKEIEKLRKKVKFVEFG